MEVGFGTGALLIEMTRRRLAVTGIDASWQMQQVAGRKMSGQGVAADRVCGRAQSLPFERLTFNNVLSTFPTNYISDAESLAEVWRILAPAGRWVIVGLGLRFKSPLKQFLAGWLLGDWENSWMQSFTNLAQEAGFQPKLVKHETEEYILPILILEKPR